MTVVIAGCGDLGTEAGLRFIAAGHSVVGLRRSPEVLPDSFATQQIDLSMSVPVLPSDTEIVVLATSADGRSEPAYRSGYVQTTDHVLRAVERDCLRVPRILMVSSTSVWNVDDGSWVDEETPANPSSPTAAVLLEAERMLHDAHPDAIVLRLGGIYGPGRGRMIDQARRGAATAGIHFTNRIHRDDAAAAIVHLTTATVAESLYLGIDNEPTDREEVLQFLATELGVQRPVAEWTSREPSTGKRCANTRLRESGFSFGFETYREGYRAILAGSGVRHP